MCYYLLSIFFKENSMRNDIFGIEVLMQQILGKSMHLNNNVSSFFITIFKIQLSVGILIYILIGLYIIATGSFSIAFPVQVTDYNTKEAVQILANVVPREYRYSLNNLNIVQSISLIYYTLYVIFGLFFAKHVFKQTKAGWYFLVYNSVTVLFLSIITNQYLNILVALFTLYILYGIRTHFKS